MGFSVTIASGIILIGLIVLAGIIITTVFYSIDTLSTTAKMYADSERNKLDVRLELNIGLIDERQITFNVTNLGSKTIFFKNQTGFQWNSIVISYQNNSLWLSYIIKNYTVLEVNVTDTQVSFDPSSHSFINPGEEARISFNLPEDAPAIPVGATVIIVFVSHYGITAQAEGVR